MELALGFFGEALRDPVAGGWFMTVLLLALGGLFGVRHILQAMARQDEYLREISQKWEEHFTALRVDVNGEIARLRHDFNGQVREMRADVKGDIHELSREVHSYSRRLERVEGFIAGAYRNLPVGDIPPVDE